MNATRPAIERMMWISQALQRGERFNLNTLALRHEVNVRTMTRDLVFMRDRLGYEIQWDQSIKSYVGKPPRERVL